MTARPQTTSPAAEHVVLAHMQQVLGCTIAQLLRGTQAWRQASSPRNTTMICVAAPFSAAFSPSSTSFHHAACSSFTALQAQRRSGEGSRYPAIVDSSSRSSGSAHQTHDGDRHGPSATHPPPVLSTSTGAVAWPPADQLGRFVILQQLGVGGMGSVFVAYDPQLDRRVALKVLHRPAGSDRQQREWTLREARALARVAHPHVVSVYEVGEAAEQVYLAMEFVDGTTLRRWQGCERRSWREVLRMYLQAGEGLLAAHRAGVVHRDFKPDNVLVGRNGLPKVADFGIARLRMSMDVCADAVTSAAPREPDTAAPKRSPELREGALLGSGSAVDDSRCAGTLGYMAPEQRSRGAISEASDQWSFCAALHEALYGRLPEVAALPEDRPSRTPHITAQETVSGPPRDGTPPEVLSILARGLAQDPERRFSGMSELLTALWAQHDQSPGAALRMSKALVGVLSVMVFLLWLVIQHIAATQARIVHYGVAISWLMILATLCVGHIHRLSLRINPFHRWMWTLLLVNFVEVLCIRSVSAWLLPLPFHVTHILEMTVWSATLTVMSTQLLRPLRWVLLIPLCSASVCAFVESPPRRLLLITYPILVCSVLWTWRLAGLNKIPVVSDRWRGRS